MALVKGILCNWMVTIGAMMALVSRSTVGKIVAMWLPIMTFFALGFEHSVVNMYILPSGMMLGAAISVKQVLFWNLLPVTLGNIIAGVLLPAWLCMPRSPSNPQRLLALRSSEFQHLPSQRWRSPQQLARLKSRFFLPLLTEGNECIFSSVI